MGLALCGDTPCPSGEALHLSHFYKEGLSFPLRGQCSWGKHLSLSMFGGAPSPCPSPLRGGTAPSRPAFLPPKLLTLTLSTDVPRTVQPGPQPAPKDGCQHQEGQTEAEPSSGSANLAAPASGFTLGEMTTTERGREGV